MKSNTAGVYGRVFAGHSLTGLTSLAETGFGAATFQVRRGSNYQIQISSYGYAKFRLGLRQVTPPSNDRFTNATAINGPATIAGSLRDATMEPGEPTFSYQSVWYRWTTPAPGLFLAAIPYGLGNVQVFTGTNLTNLVSVGQNVYGLTNGVALYAEAEETYFIAVSTYTAGTNFTLSISPQLPPVNDHFTNRLAFPPGTLSVTGSCLGATLEPDEPQIFFYPQAPTVWWKWVAPTSGVYRSSVVVPYAPYLGASSVGIPNKVSFESVTVYVGTELGELTSLGRTSRLAYTGVEHWRVEQGIEYQIAVSRNASQFTLRLELLPEPSNDDFAAATVLTRFTQATGTTDGAGVEPGEPLHRPNTILLASVWYRWMAPSNGFFTIEGPANVSLYTGDALATLTNVVLSGGATFHAESGVIYRIAVFDSGSFTLRVRPAVRPVNDDFTNAISLHGANFSFAANLHEATAELGEPAYADENLPRNSIWYAWIAPTSGSFTLRATNAYNARISVYSGDALTNLISASATLYSAADFVAQVGQNFFFSIDEYYGEGGTFRIELRHHAQPNNDHFTNALVLTGIKLSLAITNLGATSETNEPTQSYYPSRHSVWYSWTAPRSGQASFVFNSDFNPILTLYTGDSITSLVPVVPPELTPYFSPVSKLNLAVEAGVTYRLAVDGYNGESGGGTLEIYYPPVPVNDAFANRLIATNGQGHGTVQGASREPLDPFVDDDPLGGSVWWTYTPVTNGVHRIAWGATDSLTASVHRGDSLETLESVATGSYNPVRFLGEAGVPVAIQFVGTFDSFAEFDFVVTYEPPPANDFFAHRIAFANSARSTLQGATVETDEPSAPEGNGSSVWWSWVAAQSGIYEFRLVEPNYDFPIYSLGVHLYTGTNLAALQALPEESNRFTTLFQVVAGTTYAISVGSGTLAGDNFKLTPVFRPRPTNDLFDNRIGLSGPAFAVSGNTRYASRETGEPGWGGGSVWYSWTPEFDGTAAFSITGGGNFFDIFVGDGVVGLSRLGGIPVIPPPIPPGGSPPAHAVSVSAGTNYKLRVAQAYEFSSSTGFTFTLTNTPALPATAGKPIPFRAVVLLVPQNDSSLIETSTNLVDWEPFQTNAIGSTNFTVVPNPHEPQRFFRLR